ncbi:xanthine phosphoribosyltransferase [Craterilacuibacter sp. RT1T]|uniref:xanthine phosphoribosyltransferase n=1 Tax=Craterilacuibacter sp. RT1T TaxID=2942211 RepID=UPI0020C048CB|nr:xanthine phosphoribosyltransferase [Craterilacuibacter sp. RT1T]MCL6263348.1 xanthine phosphoribosyltransferase [Craterilacuibacter sp. RT1T]
MQLLKDKILSDGRLLDGYVLKVDNFLNHQLDVALLDAMGAEFARRFAGVKVDKILTVEASGIAVAVMAARHFGNVPVVFAKKTESLTLDQDAYESDVYSFTKQKTYRVRVSRRYLAPGENVLVLDDFLANGHAACGLIDIVHQAQAEVVGVGIVIEKGFQSGRKLIEEAGVTRVESLAILSSIADGKIAFA